MPVRQRSQWLGEMGGTIRNVLTRKSPDGLEGGGSQVIEITRGSKENPDGPDGETIPKKDGR